MIPLIMSLFFATPCLSMKTICQTKSCQLASNLCFINKPGCSFQDVALNPEFFIFKNKVMYETRSSDEEFLERELVDLKTKNSRLIEYLQTELNEMSESREKLRETMIQTSGGLRVRVKVRESFEIIARAEREIFVEILDEGKTLDDLSASDIFELLSFVFDEDARSLGKYLERFKDDELRTALLYPSKCGNDCLMSYRGLYGIWRKIVRKCFRKWDRRIKNFRNCDKKRWKMAVAFRKASRGVPLRLRKQLRNYYQYMVIDQICKAF